MRSKEATSSVVPYTAAKPRRTPGSDRTYLLSRRDKISLSLRPSHSHVQSWVGLGGAKDVMRTTARRSAWSTSSGQRHYALPAGRQPAPAAAATWSARPAASRPAGSAAERRGVGAAGRRGPGSPALPGEPRAARAPGTARLGTQRPRRRRSRAWPGGPAAPPCRQRRSGPVRSRGRSVAVPDHPGQRSQHAALWMMGRRPGDPLCTSRAASPAAGLSPAARTAPAQAPLRPPRPSPPTTEKFRRSARRPRQPGQRGPGSRQPHRCDKWRSSGQQLRWRWR